MNNNNDKLLKEFLQNGLKQWHSQGLLQGASAICSVIYDIADDTSKTPDERIEKIKSFCSVALNAKEKKDMVPAEEVKPDEI